MQTIVPPRISAPATASGTASPYRTSTAPSAAPSKIATTAAIRRAQLGLLPPASVESAARPVIVSVSTVVVRSGTFNWRIVALR